VWGGGGGVAKKDRDIIKEVIAKMTWGLIKKEGIKERRERGEQSTIPSHENTRKKKVGE